MTSYSAGPIVGGVLALVMAALVAYLASAGDSVYGLYLAALLAFAILGPLLIANVVLAVIYLRRGVPGRVHAWMWGPSLAVLAALALVDGVHTHGEKVFAAEHPDIREVHVNLSGRSRWLETGSGVQELPGEKAERFLVFTRYAGTGTVQPYDGARLAPEFTAMQVYLGPPGEAAPTALPVVSAPFAFPEVGTFINNLSFKGGEAAVVEYWYYHYPDRVEVAPAVNLSGSQAMDLWGASVPLVDFHIANLGARAIARLEIDGQAIALGDTAFAPESAAGFGCSRRNYEAHAVNRLAGPLKIRWQLAGADPAWQEAVVTVPKFRSGQSPRGRIHSTSVDLYFLAGGNVVAERSQYIDLPGGRVAIRTTGPAVPLPDNPPCGLAPDRYSDDAAIIRD